MNEVLNIALTEKPKAIEWDPTSIIGTSTENNKGEDDLDSETSIAH